MDNTSEYGRIYSTVHLTMSLWQHDILSAAAAAPKGGAAWLPAYHTTFSL